MAGTAAGYAAMAVGAGAAVTVLALNASQVAVASAALAAGNSSGFCDYCTCGCCLHSSFAPNICHDLIKIIERAVVLCVLP